MALRAVVLSFGILASGLPAAAQQSSQADVRQMAALLLQCNGALGAAPKVANRETNENTSAYATFAGRMGDMMADDLKLSNADRAKARADGEAAIKPPHTPAQALQTIQTCLELTSSLQGRMNAAQATKK